MNYFPYIHNKWNNFQNYIAVWKFNAKYLKTQKQNFNRYTFISLYGPFCFPHLSCIFPFSFLHKHLFKGVFCMPQKSIFVVTDLSVVRISDKRRWNATGIWKVEWYIPAKLQQFLLSSQSWCNMHQKFVCKSQWI